MSELTGKQRLFIEELVKNNWNSTQAAIASGYSKKGAQVTACRLLQKPAIMNELDRHAAQLAEENDVEVEEIIK